MRIAVLSDIHANMEALEAILADAAAQSVDEYVVAGDLITDGPDNAAVIDRVRGLGYPVIKGNREDYILQYRNGELTAWEGRMQTAGLLWANQSLLPGHLEYIAGLPEQAVLDLGCGMALRMVHGSPFSMYELLKPDADMPAVERAALAVKEQALVFGHNHMQWTGRVHGRLLLNPGSAGVHFNGVCKAEYGILTTGSGQLFSELRRVPYDFAALEHKLKTSGLMAAAPVWTRLTFEGVKAGRNYCLHFLEEAQQAMKDEGLPHGLIPNHIWLRTAERWWPEMGWGALPRSK